MKWFLFRSFVISSRLPATQSRPQRIVLPKIRIMSKKKKKTIDIALLVRTFIHFRRSRGLSGALIVFSSRDHIEKPESHRTRQHFQANLDAGPIVRKCRDKCFCDRLLLGLERSRPFRYKLFSRLKNHAKSVLPFLCRYEPFQLSFSRRAFDLFGQ